MMSHGVEHEELQAYLDRELAPGRMEELRRHLSACAECSAVLRDLQQVSAKLQSWQVEPAPASLRPPALESASRTASPPVIHLFRPWRWRPMITALSGTAVVALLILAVVIPNLLQSRLGVPPPPDQSHRSADVRVAPQAAPTQPAPPPPAAAKPVEPQRARELARKQAAADRAETRPLRGAPSGAGTGEGRGSFEERAKVAADRAAAPPPAVLSAPQLPDALAQRRADEDFRESEPAEGRQEADSKGEVAAKSAQAPAAPAAAGSVGLMRARSRANTEPEEVRRLIAYYVTLTVEVKEFAPARDKALRAVEKAGGYVSEAASAETPGQPRQASLTLRVPADKLPGVLAELRALGRVVNEQLSTDEVTEQVVDLEARLRNARATEQRLIAVLNERTGKVRDILEVEREIARTRQEIERMEAQRQNLVRRVELATVQVSLIEEYKAPLAPAPVGTVVKLRNAFVAGWDDFVGFFIGLALFFARNGLNLLFWFGLLYFIWRRLKPRLLRLVTAQ